MGHGSFLDRALVPIIRPQSATASSSVLTTRAFSSISTAETARAVAAPLGKSSGSTRINCVSPMFFIARAVAPMLPGCEVLTSTTAIWLGSNAGIHSATEGFFSMFKWGIPRGNTVIKYYSSMHAVIDQPNNEGISINKFIASTLFCYHRTIGDFLSQSRFGGSLALYFFCFRLARQSIEFISCKLALKTAHAGITLIGPV